MAHPKFHGEHILFADVLQTREVDLVQIFQRGGGGMSVPKKIPGVTAPEATMISTHSELEVQIKEEEDKRVPEAQEKGDLPEAKGPGASASTFPDVRVLEEKTEERSLMKPDSTVEKIKEEPVKSSILEQLLGGMKQVNEKIDHQSNQQNEKMASELE